jgi:hypothetical protein
MGNLLQDRNTITTEEQLILAELQRRYTRIGHILEEYGMLPPPRTGGKRSGRNRTKLDNHSDGKARPKTT